MFNKERLYAVIGAAAFVIGGIVARSKAIETAEIVEKTFNKNKEIEPAPEIGVD